MVIHSIIGEYDILYAQEREAAYALGVSESKGADHGGFLSAESTKLSAEELKLPRFQTVENAENCGLNL